MRSDGFAAIPVLTDTRQISRGKSDSLPRTPAGFTAVILDGYGLRSVLLARPITAASYPISVRQVAISLHASFRRSLAVPPLRFTRASPPSGCTGDFHPQAAGHAQHTGPWTPAERRKHLIEWARRMRRTLVVPALDSSRTIGAIISPIPAHYAPRAVAALRAGRQQVRPPRAGWRWRRAACACGRSR